MTGADFTRALFACFETLNARPPSDAALKMWLAVLKREGISFENAITALEAHLCDPDSGQFPPKPADIVKNIKGRSRDVRDSLESEAAYAWGVVLKALERHGTYVSVVFDDWRTHVALDAVGGWRYLGTIEYRDIPTVQKIFRTAYVGAKRERVKSVMLGRFDGSPVMIGDALRCEQVMALGRPVEQLAGRVDSNPALALVGDLVAEKAIGETA